MHSTGNGRLEETTYPCIIIERIYVSICNRLVNAGENSLRSHNSPSCCSLCGRLKLAKEPIFLSTAHHWACRVIRDLVDIVRVPVQISDASIVLTSVENDKVKQCTNGEASPNSQIVVHLNLADRHPLEISSNSVHLSLVNTDSTISNERGLGIVQFYQGYTVSTHFH